MSTSKLCQSIKRQMCLPHLFICLIFWVAILPPFPLSIVYQKPKALILFTFSVVWYPTQDSLITPFPLLIQNMDVLFCIPSVSCQLLLETNLKKGNTNWHYIFLKNAFRRYFFMSSFKVITQKFQAYQQS